MEKKNIISVVSALLLTLAGGFTDAYTFIYRDGVFATMQTGNLIKFFIALTNGEFKLMFLLPIIIFLLGCIIAVLLGKSKYQSQITLITLFISFIFAGLCPKTEAWNIVCVSTLSFTGAMQFEAFRRCLGLRYTSTMCTNNMRLLGKSIANRRLNDTLIYISIIVTFIFGIVLGVLVGKGMGIYAIMPLSSIYIAILLITLISKINISEMPTEIVNE